MVIQKSAEDYLEAILVLGEQNQYVRSIDIAYYLNFSKPSVSVAMKNLRENGYIQVSNEGYIALLPKGLAIAERIYERHKILTQFLVSLGVTPELAAEDACQIEHVISAESFDALKDHAVKYHFSDIQEESILERGH